MSITYPRSKDLKGLSEQEQKRAWSDFLGTVRPVKADVRVKELEAQINFFERKFNMSTSDMQQKLCSGEIADDGEIAEWDMAFRVLHAYDR